MNPLDATLDASSLNLSLDVSSLGKKSNNVLGTPLPVSLQPSTPVTVSYTGLTLHSLIL